MTRPGTRPIIADVSGKHEPVAECVVVSAEALRGTRWDPAYWGPGLGRPDASCVLPCRPLGDFVEHITYGPIVTGTGPEPVAQGVAIVGQRAIRPTGVVLDQAVTVAEGCQYDLPRCRLKPRDIVLARSGAGTLARKRFTVWHGHPARGQQPGRLCRLATVSCFVDMIRLRGANPYYVVTFLRSRLGWAQIERLINGVGTPNLSFGEIRSLRVPDPPRDEQDAIEAAWGKVRRLHRTGRLDAAEAALDELAAQLDQRLRAAAQASWL